jgi:subtilase family serine protease
MSEFVRVPGLVGKGVALASPLLCALLAGVSMSAHAGAIADAQGVASARDVGAVRAATPMQAVVWLKGAQDAGLDGAVSNLYDPASPSYHRWLSSGDLSAYAPAANELAAARASLEAQGLHVDKVLDGGTMVKVSGTAATLQSAFGTTIHQWQSNTKTFFKTSTAPKYQGANAQLVGGVSNLGSVGVHPFVARQVDFASGVVRPAVAPQAGTDPLASFTSDCFGPDHTAVMSGFAPVVGGLGSGEVDSKFTGPTYLDPTTTTGRKACGYTAKQLAQHYGLAEAHAVGWTGKGETIVIVDAFGSPTIAADVNVFSHAMGLPAMNAGSLQVVYPDGQPSDVDTDWALETTLDVEWAHAFAPDAKIVLVVAPSNDNAELAYGVEYAAEHRLGNVVSNSWGLAEADADANTAELFNHVFKRAAARGISVNVATGDSGDNGVGSPVGAASIPADSPYATGVGGTSIGIPSDDGPVEAAWGITLTQLGQVRSPFHNPGQVGFLQGSGGGESVFLKKPSFQRHLPGTGRQLPDISALADPQTGAIVAITDPANGALVWTVVGGTSLATPMFSAIWALADQAAGESLGQAAPAVAAMPDWAIRDVLPIKAKKDNTSGSIAFRAGTPVQWSAAQLLGLDQTQPTGFLGALIFVGMVPFQGWNDVGFGADSSLTAARGWDNATGYGVPNGVLFIASAKLFARDHQ